MVNYPPGTRIKKPIKNFDQIQQEMVDGARKRFELARPGERLQTGPGSIMGMLIDLQAKQLADIWEFLRDRGSDCGI